MVCENKKGHAMEVKTNTPGSWLLYSGGCPVFSDDDLHPSTVTLVLTGSDLGDFPSECPLASRGAMLASMCWTLVANP